MNMDFIVTWVDGEDPVWLAERDKVANDRTVKAPKGALAACRFRDWDVLKYWFRAVEENAPWVNKIHFVTCGQVPSFLNLDHPKLNFVTHKDYMPQKYLPTFASTPIELSFNKIESLSEHFVLFNDDMYVNRPLKKEDFFKDGKPCYCLFEKVLRPESPPSMYDYTLFNDLALVNKYFTRRDLLKTGFSKFFNLKYGKKAWQNLVYLPFKRFLGFEDPHLAVPILKSTMDEIWEKEYELLDKTSQSKLRTITGINQYIFRYWDMARGNFTPSEKKGEMYNLETKNVDKCTRDIINGENPLICINDSQRCDDFEALKKKIENAFERRYPNKCSFEK
jgi:hypothetical protein